MTRERRQLGPWVVLAWSALAVLVLVFGGLQFASFLRSPDMDVRIYYDAALALRNGEDMFAAWNPDSPLTYIYPPLLAQAIHKACGLWAETEANQKKTF